MTLFDQTYEDRREYLLCLIDGAKYINLDTDTNEEMKSIKTEFLEKGYITRTSYPNKFEITSKGATEAVRIHQEVRARNDWFPKTV